MFFTGTCTKFHCVHVPMWGAAGSEAAGRRGLAGLMHVCGVVQRAIKNMVHKHHREKSNFVPVFLSCSDSCVSKDGRNLSGMVLMETDCCGW